MKRIVLLSFSWVLLSSSVFFSGGEESNNDLDSSYHIVGKTRIKFIQLYQEAMEKDSFSYEELAHEILPELLNSPYGTGGYGCPGGKTLVNFTSFDCVTLVESFWALSYTLFEYQQGENDDPDPFRVFAQNIDQIRYFGGENCGPSERIHYFTQSMQELERSGYVFNVAIANGTRFKKRINYISTNLKYDMTDLELKRLKSLERIMYTTQNYYYRKSNADLYYPLAKTGDLIAFAAEEPGLDVSHTGIVVEEDGELMLYHASSLKNKVIRQSLQQYINYRTRITGLFVYRPKFESN